MIRSILPFRGLGGWRGPSLALQILGLLLGGLIVAQMVTLFLTLVLPPAPPAQYGLRDIAAALDPGLEPAKTLHRTVQAGPPDLSGPGWLTAEGSRGDLAGLLGADREDVRLAFYTPLPFAGVAGPPPRSFPEGAEPASWLVFAQAAPGAIPGGMPGGGLPGGGFPGGFPRGGFPGSGMPGRTPGAVPGSGLPSTPRAQVPGSGSGFPGRGAAGGVPSTAAPGGLPFTALPQGGGAAGTTLSPALESRIPIGSTAVTAPLQGTPNPGALNMLAAPSAARLPSAMTMPGLSPLPTRTLDAAATPAPAPRRTAPDVAAPRTIAETPPAVTTSPSPRPAVPTIAVPVIATPNLAPPAARVVPRAEPMPVRREPGAVPVARTSRALFGLAPAPFVEGDFIAARRLADGRWAVVQPAAEGFPNAWQRRIGLWFLIAFALVAPLGWLFARRLSGPLDRFADAAQRLGRDPSAAIAALDGPAEIGRAAHAFNLMQSRLRSFVDDRTAMVGAISHDLRTPLTRLRFRLEEVDNDAMREGMLDEVVEMEEMISSVLAFIRDASTPGVRERLDLRTLVDDVAEDAAMIGGQVTVDAHVAATVEVDVLGMRRLLANLVENALKYGRRAHIKLEVGEEEAIAAVIDEGPGLPEDELELVFQPFYRTAAARASEARGTGLGLAVCRSIARAHGGDVRLRRGPEGFMAEVRVPLVYETERPLAA